MTTSYLIGADSTYYDNPDGTKKIKVEYHFCASSSLPRPLKEEITRIRKKLAHIGSPQSCPSDTESDIDEANEKQEETAAFRTFPQTDNKREDSTLECNLMGFDFLDDTDTQPAKAAKEKKVKVKKASKAERNAARTAMQRDRLNLTEANYATLSLIVSHGDNTQNFKLTRTEAGFYAFLAASEPAKEILFISGCKNSSSVSRDRFVWSELFPYDTCTWQSHKEGLDHQKHIVHNFMAMKDKDLYQQLLKENPTLEKTISSFKESSDQDQTFLYNKAFTFMKENVCTTESGVEKKWPTLCKLNGFCCSEATISRLLREGKLKLPPITNGAEVSVVVGSKWSPCITCATNLDHQCQPLLDSLARIEGIKIHKFFLALETYSSRSRGFPNRNCETAGTWNLLIRKRQKNSATLLKEESEQEGDGMSRASTFFMPGSAEKALRERDVHSTQTSPSRNAKQQDEAYREMVARNPADEAELQALLAATEKKQDQIARGLF